jgi:hypothetical protein
MYWLYIPKFPVTVCGEAGSSAAAADCENTAIGMDNAADTAEASISLRMEIPFI